MMYNYMRVVIKVAAPEEETTLKMMAAYRKSSQQIEVLAQEVKENVVLLKNEVKEIVPDEITKSPFEKFMIKSTADVEMPQSGLSGSDLSYEAWKERKRLREAKRASKMADALLEQP